MYKISATSFGSFLGIGMVSYLAMLFGQPLLIPSFGATSFIVSVIPDSAFAQPRNVIGGHILSSLTAIICLLVFGVNWWSYAVAVGLAVFIMQLTRTMHPPAAADPVVVMMQGNADWGFLIEPILASSIVLVVVAFLFHNFLAKRSYPNYWY